MIPMNNIDLSNKMENISNDIKNNIEKYIDTPWTKIYRYTMDYN